MLWNDVFLQWNPDDYDGLDELLLPMERIWYPDLTIHNMISLESLVPDDKNYAIIDYHGNVLISIAQLITFNCKYRIADFPFDTQNCSLHVVSWMHNAAQMDIFAMMPTDLGPYKTNAEWNLLSMNSRREYNCYAASKTPFVDVYYDVIIQRKPGYYLTTFFVPSFIITTLAIVGIFGPFNDSGDREEKVTMGLTTLLTMAVILLLVTGQIPKSSGSMPLLGLFIILEIALSACASLTSVFVMFQHGRWTKGHPIPKWIVLVTWMHCDGAENENV
uniref:Uncharacterized protein n=1 Tax=Plectus sambesii TaxID=2011161 RepID=A0A914WTU9_9BILA